MAEAVSACIKKSTTMALAARAPPRVPRALAAPWVSEILCVPNLVKYSFFSCGRASQPRHSREAAANVSYNKKTLPHCAHDPTTQTQQCGGSTAHPRQPPARPQPTPPHPPFDDPIGGDDLVLVLLLLLRIVLHAILAPPCRAGPPDLAPPTSSAAQRHGTAHGTAL